MASTSPMQSKFEAEVDVFNALQKDYSKAVSARTQLEAQLSENEAVKKEFELLKDDTVVYKLIGPVLVKHDRVEAADNVIKRIEFIRVEISRLENQIKDLNEKQDKKKEELVKMQQMVQQAAAAGGKQ
ncbi:hypothetical protein SmJEL517_g01983 [Synchytrium microbalum]|uniref:Prefoldin subunit 6 n=1 Tax=Synchytrium microbalum TaxID=1806994 RepID=A0A507C879_9FUNG|nr:uncharacterized protein SmJEL517_g01983 [Synchytrium microbalum]TPX35721.1 hypothetical protein SmJEL517_g01983 [Synchytrium microbalum]